LIALLLFAQLAVAPAPVAAQQPEPAAAPGPAAAPEPAAAPGPAAAPEPIAVADSPITVSTRITPDPSNIGDLLELEIVAAFARGYSVNLPVGASFAPLHLVDVTEGEPEVTGDGLRKTFRVRLQHFATGPAEVPAFALTYVDPDGAVATVSVPATAFTVDSLLANEADPERKPEDPPISIEYPNTLAETVILSVLATTAALFILFLVARRVLRRRRPAVVVPAIPPHVLALDALTGLEQSELLAEGRVQDYYLQLSEIAKGYLERRFGLPALDRTTDEIRRDLLRQGARIEPLTPTEIIEFLQRSDLVKFARFHPEDDESREALGFVRGAVERSKPVQDPPKPAANAQAPAEEAAS
jgi:hypothetical protein